MNFSLIDQVFLHFNSLKIVLRETELHFLTAKDNKQNCKEKKTLKIILSLFDVIGLCMTVITNV